MKKIVFTGLLLAVTVLTASAQTKKLDRLSKVKRDSILISLAKETILKYGPDFYEEGNVPKIEREVVTEEDLSHLKEEFYKKEKKNIGRAQYIVTYPSEYAIKGINPRDYLAQVHIWEDSGLVYTIRFPIGGGIREIYEIPKKDDKDHVVFLRPKPGEPKKTTRKEYDKRKK